MVRKFPSDLFCVSLLSCCSLSQIVTFFGVQVIKDKLVIFDIGAYDGTTFLKVAREYKHNIQVFAFEPLPELVDVISSSSKDLPNYFLTKSAVSNFNGSSIFNVSNLPGCSSLYEFSDRAQVEWGNTSFNMINRIEVKVVRLDSFLFDHNITQIDWLHCDTQGNDLKVLESLGDYIRIVKGGRLEVATKPDILYFGNATLDDARAFLEPRGFEISMAGENDGFGNEICIDFRNKIYPADQVIRPYV